MQTKWSNQLIASLFDVLEHSIALRFPYAAKYLSVNNVAFLSANQA
jgi:hypothetical protein